MSNKGLSKHTLSNYSKKKPKLHCKILDPILLGTLMFTYEIVEKVTWERYPISGWWVNTNYHKLKLVKQKVVV